MTSLPKAQEPPALTIYKIEDRRTWESAVRSGTYGGSADDLRDGFIHFSTARQLDGTLAKHYAGRPDLVVAAIDVGRLGPALKWEAARNGDLFPHLYGALSMTAVSWVEPVPLDTTGRHVLPEGVL